MSRAVWKFTIPFIGDETRIDVPAGATILPLLKIEETVAFVWFDVDVDAKVEPRTLIVVGTGAEFAERPKERIVYVVSAFDGPFVWHLFEKRSVR